MTQCFSQPLQLLKSAKATWPRLDHGRALPSPVGTSWKQGGGLGLVLHLGQCYTFTHCRLERVKPRRPGLGALQPCLAPLPCLQLRLGSEFTHKQVPRSPWAARDKGHFQAPALHEALRAPAQPSTLVSAVWEVILFRQLRSVLWKHLC